MVLKTSLCYFFAFCFAIWLWKLHILGQRSEIGCDLRLREHMSEIKFKHNYGEMYRLISSDVDSDINSERYSCLNMLARDCGGQHTHLPCVTSACTLPRWL